MYFFHYSGLSFVFFLINTFHNYISSVFIQLNDVLSPHPFNTMTGKESLMTLTLLGNRVVLYMINCSAPSLNVPPIITLSSLCGPLPLAIAHCEPCKYCCACEMCWRRGRRCSMPLSPFSICAFVGESVSSAQARSSLHQGQGRRRACPP